LGRQNGVKKLEGKVKGERERVGEVLGVTVSARVSKVRDQRETDGLRGILEQDDSESKSHSLVSGCIRYSSEREWES